MAETPESKIKKKLDKWIQLNMPGAFRFRVPGGPFGQVGMGDYILVWLGVPIMIEVKADETKSATDLQIKQLKIFQAAGGIACVLKGFQEWKLLAIKEECEIRSLRIELNTPDSGDHCGSSEYGIWFRIKKRCENGEISLDPSWTGGIEDFRKFFNHIGPRPTMMHTVDRIDPRKGYVEGNVRWADKETQANNKIETVLYTVKGHTGTLSQLANLFGVDKDLVYSRFKCYGWPLEDCFAQPHYSRKRKA